MPIGPGTASVHFLRVLEPTCSTLGGDCSMAVKLIRQPGARRGSGGAGTVLCHQPHRDPSPTWPGQGSFLNCCCNTLPVQPPEKMYKYCWALMVLREWSCLWRGSRLWLGLRHSRSQGKCSRGALGGVSNIRKQKVEQVQASFSFILLKFNSHGNITILKWHMGR